ERNGRDRDRGKRSREGDSERPRERRRSKDKDERRRSRTPDSSRRRSVSRDRDRERWRRRSPNMKDLGPRRDRTTRSGHEREESLRSPVKRSGPLPSQDDSFAFTVGASPEKPKEKPNFSNTGLLA